MRPATAGLTVFPRSFFEFGVSSVRESIAAEILRLAKDNTIYSALAFTRTKARANRLAEALVKHKIPTERIHGNRSQGSELYNLLV